MSAVQMERGQRVVLIGDSHCLPLNNLVYRHPHERTPFLVVGHHIEGCRASDIATGTGHVGARLFTALRGLGLLREDGTAPWMANRRDGIEAMFLAGDPVQAPVLILTCGDVDLKTEIFRAFGDRFDVEVPGGTAPPAPGVEVRPLADVAQTIAAHLRPVVDGAALLVGAGFRRTYVAMIPPPALADDAAFAALYGFRCPLDVRRRLTRLANDVLRQLCGAAGIVFVDVADRVAADGLLRPEYRLDHTHMTPDAGRLLLEDVLTHAAQNGGNNVNTALYEHARTHAEPVTETGGDVARARAEFEANGIIMRRVDVTGLLAAIGDRPFDRSMENRHIRLSWFGNLQRPGRGYGDVMKALEPDEPVLRAFHDLFYSGPALGYVQAALGADPNVVNARFFESHPHVDHGTGPQAYHHDGTPPGMVRALVYLVDVDEDGGPFEYLDADNQRHFATGPQGSLVIFDANRLLHRGSPPRKRPRRVVDLCVAPRPLGMPRRVTWAGMNNWPVDPYQFAVDDMRAWPPFDADWVRCHPFPPSPPAA